jgi:hypothetical protein
VQIHHAAACGKIIPAYHHEAENHASGTNLQVSRGQGDRENGLAFVINPLSKSAHATACGAVNDHNTLEDMSARKSMTMPLLDSIERFN